jgi:hypothetical protein
MIGIVNFFNFQLVKSTKVREHARVSFFKTMIIEKEYGILPGHITPTSNNSLKIFLVSFFLQMDNCKDTHWMIELLESVIFHDHARHMRELSQGVFQIPHDDFPKPIEDKHELLVGNYP